MRNDGSIERDEAIATSAQLARARRRIKELEAEVAELELALETCKADRLAAEVDALVEAVTA